MATARRDWFGQMLESSLKLKLQTPDGLLEHATPSVLVESLPSEEISAVLAGALKSGKMSAQHVVDTVAIDTLNEFLPEEVLWASVSAAAVAAGLDGSAAAAGKAREWIEGAMSSGLATEQLTAESLLDHATPSVLTESLPNPISAAVLEASLAAGSISPQLVLDTVGVPALAEHLPAGVLWTWVASAVDGAPAKGSKKASKADKQASKAKEEPATEAPEADQGLDEVAVGAQDAAHEADEATEVAGGDRTETLDLKRSSSPSPGRVLSGNTGIGKPSLGGSRIRGRR